MSDKPGDNPQDPAFSPTDHYDEAAIKRARELLNNMPESVGPYRILERIGGGGMGEVYRAEQRSPIRRQVALKFIKLGMDSQAVLARFEAERQALALMDHPHIAKVFDAGTDDTGRPYFVMEYVKGKPITDYADQNHLTIRERLELFEQVCQAIQHAHHKGVIHRDLKPGNVLVSTQDDRPFAKVIDFGIAKAIAQRLTDETLFTQHDQFLGTPQYMSPEQAEGSVDIDTRTDVYSLGVLLYELLTGSTPFSTHDLRAAAFEQLKRLIIEVDPPKPSTRLTLNQPTLSTLAASRRTEPKRLGTLVQGELDWIVMKSLEKDRKRRYETPTSLANDIQAHLQGEPVQAAPPSTAYRIQKFVKKHRGPVIAVTVIMAVLLLGVAGTTWGLIRARIAEHAASESERKKEIALGQVIEERDAKEQQRKAAESAKQAESEQRAKAERQIVGSILRPIGFNKDSLDPAELKSLADWSALGDSHLQLLALEVAFEDPATALRVARRAERVIQSCVGVSPNRRTKAIELVIVKQHDRTADPRIRVAACWMALELGSSDLSALDGSVAWLSDPSAKASAEFDEFVTCALARTESRQRTEVNRVLCDALLAISEKSANETVLSTAGKGLVTLAPQLGPEQVTRGWNAFLAVIEKSKDWKVLQSAGDVFIALAPKLERATIMYAWDALLAVLDKSKDGNVQQAAGKGLVALTRRLNPAQVTRGYDDLLAILSESKDENVREAAGEGLVALAPSLEPAQVTRIFDALVLSLNERMNNTGLGLGSNLYSLASSLELAQVNRNWDALLAVSDKMTGTFGAFPAGAGLHALAQRLDPAQVAIRWDTLVTVLEKKTKDGNDPIAAAMGLLGMTQRLEPSLEPAQVTRGWNALLASLENSTNPYAPMWMGYALNTLTSRLETAQVTRALDALLAVVGKSTNQNVLDAAGNCLVTLAPMLESAQVARSWDAMVAILEKSTDRNVLHEAGKVLAALAPRLELAHAARGGEVLFTVFQKSKDTRVLIEAGYVLVALAPRLSPAVQSQIVEALIESLHKFDDERTTVILSTLMPLLDIRTQNKIATQVIAVMLGRVSSSPKDDTVGIDGYVRVAVVVMSDQRSLARLLSHPGCVDELREILIQRFEELVFHDGKHVFLPKPEPEAEAETSQVPEPVPPSRQFHNLHDAAAWIQLNWHDFDLETNHPVTWRGEQK